MRRVLLVVVLSSYALAPGSNSAGQPPSRPPSRQAGNTALETTLNQLDAAARNFKSAEADFTWDQYQKVINETDVQKGRIYFRRRRDETQMAADITQPDEKYLLFSQGKVRFYQPRIDQVTEHDTGKHRAEVASFLALGFGGGGHDLLRSFTIQDLGPEMVDGMRTAKLDLTPRSAKVRNMFQHIVLWLDTTRAVSLKQQAFEPSGDYRLAHYTDIRVNRKLPDEIFKLKTTGKTKVVQTE